MVEGIAGALVQFALKLAGALVDWFRGRKPRRGEPRLSVIPQVRSTACYWAPGRIGGRAATMPLADLHVTNRGDQPVELSSARIRLRTGFLWWRTFTGSCTVSVQHRGLVRNVLPPGVMMDVRTHFPIPLEHEPGDFKASVALVDQYGGWHWARGVRFRDPRQPLGP